ncbi:hypothetical protein [Paenibacillus motobuensis]|uniref:Uncharacterized protein n=1 Tax=Paenibacillus motobuensis TaxID=295324 RepID=A0ABP3HW31_9BACL
MNWKQATDTELLQIIYHEPGVSLSLIQEAAEEYSLRHGRKAKWWRMEGRTKRYA